MMDSQGMPAGVGCRTKGEIGRKVGREDLYDMLEIGLEQKGDTTYSR